MIRSLYLALRERVRARLARMYAKRHRAFLAMPVDKAPRFDERSTIARFRRENGLR